MPMPKAVRQAAIFSSSDGGPWSQIGMVAPKSESAVDPASFQHPLLEHTDLDTPARTIYSGTLSVEKHWALADHRFHGGDSLLPGTAYLEIAVAALWQKIGRQPVALENVVFLAPLRVAPNTPVLIHAILQKDEDEFQFSVTSQDVTYATGRAGRCVALHRKSTSRKSWPVARWKKTSRRMSAARTLRFRSALAEPAPDRLRP